MDDILNPADTAEVSRLMKEDPAAEQLVQRISEVVRKRRLSAPQPLDESQGKDANDVAEYLDNLMSPEQIRQFEQSCLDSDEQLAEVAACHEILTLILGGKSNVPDSTRKKLEQIANSVGYTASDEGKLPGAEPIPLSAVDIPVTDSGENDSSSETHVPATFEIPKRNSTWKNKGAVIAIGLLFIAWFYSIATDESLRPGKKQNTPQIANNQLAVAGPNQPSGSSVEERKEHDSAMPARSEQSGNAESEKKTPQQPPTEPRTLVSAAEPKIKPEKMTKASIDPEPPELPKLSVEEPENFQPPLVKPAQKEPSKELAMVDKNKTLKPGKEQPDLEKPEPVCFTPTIVYTSDNQHVIRQAVSQTNAVLLKEMTEIEPGDRLFCLQNSQAEFSIDNGKGNLKVFENSALELLGADERSCFGFALRRGRLIYSYQPDASEKTPKKIRLVIREIPWYFEIPTKPGSIIIEVTPQKSTHYEQLPKQGLLLATAWVAGPAVRILSQGGQWEEIKQARQLLPLPSSQIERPKQENDQETATSNPIPDWATRSEAVPSSLKNRDQREFIKKIEGSVNLWLDLEGVATDPNPYIAQFAAQALSLGERYESLVNILVHSPHEESRTAAINGLREWLPQAPGNRELLRTLLSQTVNEETESIIYKLLWGYDEKDAKDPEISQQLVNWLRHDQAAVRELSIYWIHHLTGKKLGYRPLASLKTREQGATTWQRHLNKIGALLPPQQQ